jgi:N-acetylmuramoyl-L-alanine amidase
VLKNNLLKAILFSATLILTTGFAKSDPVIPPIIQEPVPYLQILEEERLAREAEHTVEPPVQINDAELHCLARNIYFEARGEGRQGMLAVGHVTLNRVRSNLFPNTICGVVHQRSQFSWTRNPGRVSGPLWTRSQEIAREIMAGETRDPTNGALYFHNGSVRPSWSHRFRRTATIGNHYFYRRG